MEVKKSARLAEKRKLKEESGPPSEDNTYFTYFSKKTSSSSLSSEATNKSNVDPLSPSILLKSPRSSPSPSKSGKDKSSPNKRNKSISPLTAQTSGSQEFITSTILTTDESTTINVYSPNKKKLFEQEILFSSNTSGCAADSSTSNKSLFFENNEISEEKWLDAIEEGKLDELNEEFKLKNPKLLTARQRALLEKKSDKDYTFYNEYSFFGKEKEVTQEMIKLKAEKTEKRRIQAQEKKEQDKIKTMDKILKKQQTKIVKSVPKAKISKTFYDAKITYLIRPDSNFIIFPKDIDIPFSKKSSLPSSESLKQPSQNTICIIQGCGNIKSYLCSKTKLPLCSGMECYKKNLANNVSI